MDIKWLKTFVIAAKYENFRQASEELFLTQPAITKHIQRLEQLLHVKLFERDGKNIFLSSAGHSFLPFAKEFLKKYEQGLGEFESWKQGYNRKLTIATAPQIASSFLPPIVRRFVEGFPKIEIIINVVSSYEVGVEVSTGKADIGLSRITPIQANIHCEKIHEDNVVLVAPFGAIEHEEEVLKKYRVMTHNHPEYWDELLRDIKNNYPFVRTMNVNQMEITKRFIEHGLGVSYLPYSIVKQEIDINKFIAVKNDKINQLTSSTFVVTKVQTDEVINFYQVLKEAF